jgi:hypothetical protein
MLYLWEITILKAKKHDCWDWNSKKQMPTAVALRVGCMQPLVPTLRESIVANPAGI